MYGPKDRRTKKFDRNSVSSERNFDSNIKNKNRSASRKSKPLLPVQRLSLNIRVKSRNRKQVVVAIKPKRPLNECNDILLYIYAGAEWQRRSAVNVPQVFQVRATAAKLKLN